MFQSQFSHKFTTRWTNLVQGESYIPKQKHSDKKSPGPDCLQRHSSAVLLAPKLMPKSVATLENHRLRETGSCPRASGIAKEPWLQLYFRSYYRKEERHQTTESSREQRRAAKSQRYSYQSGPPFLLLLLTANTATITPRTFCHFLGFRAKWQVLE